MKKCGKGKFFEVSLTVYTSLLIVFIFFKTISYRPSMVYIRILVLSFSQVVYFHGKISRSKSPRFFTTLNGVSGRNFPKREPGIGIIVSTIVCHEPFAVPLPVFCGFFWVVPVGVPLFMVVCNWLIWSS